MGEELKADIDAAMAELEHALWLAIKQGALKDGFQWSAPLNVEGQPNPWFAVLTVGEVFTTAGRVTPPAAVEGASSR